MFPRRSADKPSYGRHKAARRLQIAVRSEQTCSSAGFISHWRVSLDSTSDAQLIHLKRPSAGAHRSLPARSLSSAERVNIYRHCLDGGWVETPRPGGHDAGTAVGNGLDDRRLVRAIEPDLVGKIRRAEFLISLARVAVTHHAVFCEDFCARARIISLAGG